MTNQSFRISRILHRVKVGVSLLSDDLHKICCEGVIESCIIIQLLEYNANYAGWYEAARMVHNGLGWREPNVHKVNHELQLSKSRQL